MKITLLSLISLLCLFTVTYARDALARTCRIVFLDRPAGAPPPRHLFDGPSPQEVDLSGINLSPVYQLAPGTIQFKLLPAKVVDTKGISPEAPSIETPADYNDFFLLVASDPNKKIAPVKIEVVNIAIRNFRLGQTLRINKSDHTIEGKLGSQILSLKPEGYQVVNPPISDEGIAASNARSLHFHLRLRQPQIIEPVRRPEKPDRSVTESLSAERLFRFISICFVVFYIIPFDQ